MNRIPHWEKINEINLAHPVSVSRWENRISDYWSTLPPFIDVFFIYEGSSLGRMTRPICLCLFYQGGGRIVGLLEEAFDRTDFLLPELHGLWRSWSEGWKWRFFVNCDSRHGYALLEKDEILSVPQIPSESCSDPNVQLFSAVELAN